MQTTRPAAPPLNRRANQPEDLFRALRPAQWLKNSIVFAPLLFAEKIHNPQLLLMAGLCFLSFCLISSAAYLLNDVMDKNADQLHPLKRKRPIAQGKVSSKAALFLALTLALAGTSVSFASSAPLAVVVICYVILTVAYSTKLKHLPLIDVFTIAACFVLRAVAGAVAVKVPVSTWFLLCTSLGALFLALEKRRHEVGVLRHEAEAHRPAITIYTPEMVNRLEAIILPGLLTCYVLYSFQSSHGPWMMLTLPFVLYGVMRYLTLSAQPDSRCGFPEQVILQDRPLQIALVLWLVCCALVIYNVLPAALSASGFAF